MGTRLAMSNSAMTPRLEASCTWISRILVAAQGGSESHRKSHESQRLIRAQGESFELPRCFCQL